MASTVHLYTCNNPCSVRPREEYLLTVKELAPKIIEKAADFDRSDFVQRTIVVPYALRDVPEKMLKDAIEYVYSTHGCDHEGDCCGCAVNRAYPHTLRRIRRGVFTFKQSMGFNY